MIKTATIQDPQGIPVTATAEKAVGQFKIAIASGKGGTGKSFVALNLACTLALDREIMLLDCDVEEPNLHLYFSCPWNEEEVTQPVPEIDAEVCNRCGKCGEVCQYGAMTVLPDRILFLQDLCHACGACVLSCPLGAIHEGSRTIGKIRTGRPLPGLTLVSGILHEGEVATPRLIRKVKEAASGYPLVISDGPPGSACPVIETLEGNDLCLLVTESTPFGLHDLQKAVGVTKKLGIPAGVLINRSIGEDNEIADYCMAEDIPLLDIIPFDREIARLHGRGGILTLERTEWQPFFRELFDRCNAILERESR
jgi:MinD superfamily P-loop ATPase